MPIDYDSFFAELATTSQQVRLAMAECAGVFLNDGFNLPFMPVDEIHERQATGVMYFERVWNEIHKSLSTIESANALILEGVDETTQRAFDELALRQRKLFECLCSIIGLSQSGIYLDQNHPYYFVHFHLTNDLERLRLMKIDTDYMGAPTDIIEGQINSLRKYIEEKISPYTTGELCTWGRSARAHYLMASKQANMLEKVALGLSYHAVFGSSSSQIHLNMSKFHDTLSSSRSFTSKLDNLLLLAVCIVCRAINIIQILGHSVGTESQRLMREFSDTFPNTYAAAICGAAEEGDIVVVFTAPHIFLGVVEDKLPKPVDMNRPMSKRQKKRAMAQIADDEKKPFVKYRIIPLFNTGRIGWYADFETMVCLPKSSQTSVIENAIAQKFIDAGLVDQPLAALAQICQNQAGYDQFIKGPMDKTVMTPLYFVQRYLTAAGGPFLLSEAQGLSTQ